MFFFCEGRTKKIFSRVFVWTWTRAPHHAERRVYHQSVALDITKAKALYIIIAKEDTACGWWYTPSVMRYTLKRDDIPLISQWIKKFDKSKLVEFFGRRRGTRTPNRRFWRPVLYQLSYTPVYWCGRRELNPYGKTTRPSNVRVCQFRHSRRTSSIVSQKIRFVNTFFEKSQKSWKIVNNERLSETEK